MKTYSLSFSEISLICSYGKWGYEGRNSNNHGFEWTCRHRSNIPNDHSWEVCSEKTCPLISRKVTNFRIFNEDGELVAKADEAEIKYC